MNEGWLVRVCQRVVGSVSERAYQRGYIREGVSVRVYWWLC